MAQDLQKKFIGSEPPTVAERYQGNVDEFKDLSKAEIDPKHYHLKIEPWDFIYANQLSFAEGNVIKYICRWREKDGVEDLKKAKQYIDMLIEKEKT